MTNEIIGRYNDDSLKMALSHIKYMKPRERSALVIAPLYGTIIHEDDPNRIMPPRKEASRLIRLIMDKEVPIFYSSPKNYSATIEDIRLSFLANEEFTLLFREKRMLPSEGDDLFANLYTKLEAEGIEPQNAFLITTKDDFSNYPRNRLNRTFLVPPYNEPVPALPVLSDNPIY